MYGGECTHAPTMAYELRDVVLSNGHLFTFKAYLPVSSRAAPLFAKRLNREFTDGVLASSSYGIKYFGHWMQRRPSANAGGTRHWQPHHRS